MSENAIALRDDSPIQVFNPSLPVTRDMLDALSEQRKLLKEFVSKHLIKDPGDGGGDYGVIPGTKKPSLYKSGAEKLRGLFGLRVEIERTDREIDRQGNFAMFTYKAKVFRGDVMIAECEGSTNSQEKKYRERKAWVYNPQKGRKEETLEATPVCDVLNTLQKMAQKRAFVGAIILAVGASDFFTQDFDSIEDARDAGAIPTEQPGPSSVPKVVNVTSTVTHNQQRDVSPKSDVPLCRVCGTQMIVSKAGSSYYCPNFKNTAQGEHSRFSVADLSKYLAAQGAQS